MSSAFSSTSTHSYRDSTNLLPTTTAPTSASSSSSSITGLVMPRIGETRCYWALLNNNLEFIFLDPVLAHHLEDQADILLGHRLLEFVHPDEYASASVDLQGMLDSRTLHGSVTRVRFSRLSSIRRRMGFQGTPVIPEFMRAGGVFYDDEYMPCNIVINVAASNVVLCFIHAVTDISPEDNDERIRNNWTNWCGTTAGGLSPETASKLFEKLTSTLPPYQEDRVFQILRHSVGRPAVLSYPPDLQGKDFANLANRIDIQLAGFEHPHAHNPTKSNDAKTSCTRRYKSELTINSSDGLERDIESIFVPYGCMIFACHRVKGQRRISTMYHQQAPVGYPFDQASQGSSAGNNSNGPGFGAWNGNPGQWSGSYPADGSGQAQASDSGASTARTSSGMLPEARDAASPVEDGADNKDKKSQRVGGAPPAGVTRCSNCKIKSSPEWRKGPSGKKDLCNACGLRYARSRAKKDGSLQPKKKKSMDGEGTPGPSRGGGRKNSGASTTSAAGGSYTRALHEDYDGVDTVSDNSPPLPAPYSALAPSNYASTPRMPSPTTPQPYYPQSMTLSHSQSHSPSEQQHPQMHHHAYPQPAHHHHIIHHHAPPPPPTAYTPSYGHPHQPQATQALSLLSRAAQAQAAEPNQQHPHPHHQHQHPHARGPEAHHLAAIRGHDRSPGPPAGAVYVR